MLTKTLIRRLTYLLLVHSTLRRLKKIASKFFSSSAIFLKWNWQAYSSGYVDMNQNQRILNHVKYKSTY